MFPQHFAPMELKNFMRVGDYKHFVPMGLANLPAKLIVLLLVMLR